MTQSTSKIKDPVFYKPVLHAYPDLGVYELSAEELAHRRKFIGGSDATIIALGQPEAINDLWMEKRGMPRKARTKSLNMYMGNATEALNAAWYAHVTGDRVTMPQMIVERDYGGLPLRASLDGICGDGDAIFEAKHVSGYDFQAKAQRTITTVAAEYYAQLQHNMMAADKDRAVLSVLFDNGRHEYATFEADPFYQDGLAISESNFWDAVTSGSPPHADLIKVNNPEKIVPTRTVDMTGNNAWSAAAHQWLCLRDTAKQFDLAAADLKSMMDQDALRAIGHGVMLARDKRGSVRITATATGDE